MSMAVTFETTESMTVIISVLLGLEITNLKIEEQS